MTKIKTIFTTLLTLVMVGCTSIDVPTTEDMESAGTRTLGIDFRNIGAIKDLAGAIKGLVIPYVVMGERLEILGLKCLGNRCDGQYYSFLIYITYRFYNFKPNYGYFINRVFAHGSQSDIGLAF